VARRYSVTTTPPAPPLEEMAMAKSVQMARCMARVKRHTPMPSKVIRSPQGIFMAREDYKKLQRELARDSLPAQAVDLVTAGAVPSIGGLPIYISQACEPWIRFDGYPLLRYARRYLRRHAQRSTP
jgi:hypothetical protein